MVQMILGRLTDHITGPYENEQEARMANNGALPPDLSFIVSMVRRKGAEDYIFHLLTNFTDPPAGITVEKGQHNNPYIPDGAIGILWKMNSPWIYTYKQSLIEFI